MAVTDDDIETARRKWELTGKLEDEVRYIAARHDAWKFRSHEVYLAALLGHPASRIVLEDQNDSHPATVHLTHWMRLIHTYRTSGDRVFTTPQPVVRASLAIARLALPICKQENGLSDLYRTLEAARAWCLDPTEENLQSGRSLVPATARTLDTRIEGSPSKSYAAAHLLHYPTLLMTGAGASVAARVAVMGLRIADDETLRGAVRAELVPWLYGYSEPLASSYGPS